MAHAARRAAVGRGKDGKGTLCTRAAQPTHVHMLRCRGECECPDHTRVQPSQGVVASGIVPVPRARLCPHSTENDATANGPGTECPDLKESAGNGCWWRSAEADILCDVCRSVTSTGCLWALHHPNPAPCKKHAMPCTAVQQGAGGGHAHGTRQDSVGRLCLCIRRAVAEPKLHSTAAHGAPQAAGTAGKTRLRAPEPAWSTHISPGLARAGPMHDRRPVEPANHVLHVQCCSARVPGAGQRCHELRSRRGDAGWCAVPLTGSLPERQDQR